jgi:hypothetical protein
MGLYPKSIFPTVIPGMYLGWLINGLGNALVFQTSIV